MMKISIPTKDNAGSARVFLAIMQGFHGLKGQEFEVMSYLLAEYLNLSEEVKRDSAIFELLFSSKSRKTMGEELSIDKARLGNILSALRRKNILEGKSIRKALIPVFKKNNCVISFEIEAKK